MLQLHPSFDATKAGPARLFLEDRFIDRLFRQFRTTNAVDRPLGATSKRMLDLAIALSALVLAAPLMLLVVLLVKCTSQGPVFFAHPRLGFNRSTFQCLKFRTMVVDADACLRRHLDANPEAAAEWQLTRKLKNDPRVTCIGRILRRSSLDELPQLVNVLRGDMSCVGPRPIVAAEISRYGVHAVDYFRSRPGMTGMWQISGRNSLSYDHRVALDRIYARRWSLALDCMILLRTPMAVLKFDSTS